MKTLVRLLVLFSLVLSVSSCVRHAPTNLPTDYPREKFAKPSAETVRRMQALSGEALPGIIYNFPEVCTSGRLIVDLTSEEPVCEGCTWDEAWDTTSPKWQFKPFITVDPGTVWDGYVLLKPGKLGRHLKAVFNCGGDERKEWLFAEAYQSAVVKTEYRKVTMWSTGVDPNRKRREEQYSPGF